MINWDDFNYDDINWDDLKKYFEGGNTGESYFDPNDWYASGATYSYNDYKEGFDKNYQEWLKQDLANDDIDEEEAIYLESNNLYEVLMKIDNCSATEKNKILLQKDNIFHSGKDKIIKELISYFEELEEYEKCANLLKLL